MSRTRNSLILLGSVMFATPGMAQEGNGFLFRAPKVVVSAFGGYAMPMANSDLFDFTSGQLTLGKSDFAGMDRGADLSIAINERLDISVGVSHSQSSSRSEFRDWVDGDDQPIEQTTSFSRTPLTVSLRYHPLPRGRTIGSFAWIPAPFDPWVGIGVGRMKYGFIQRGDFIDFTDPAVLVVFGDTFRSSGWANMVQASVGAGWSLSPRFILTGELRYINARGTVGQDFEGFQKIDLSGAATTFGIAFRL